MISFATLRTTKPEQIGRRSIFLVQCQIDVRILPGCIFFIIHRYIIDIGYNSNACASGRSPQFATGDHNTGQMTTNGLKIAMLWIAVGLAAC